MALIVGGTNWAVEAACRGTDPEIFFPAPGRASFMQIERALSYCKVCPVRSPCLEEALRAEALSASAFRAGIFGGTTARERAGIARRRRDRSAA